MPRQEHILTVFVASPSDLADERARLEEVITELNQTWSRSHGIRLDLVRWESHAYPGFGQDAQDVINQQIPQDYDVFIGIMWHRFGTPTGRAESGTEEEFTRAKARWDADHTTLNLMIYFKDAPLSPSQIDPLQLSRLTEFKKTLGEEGALYWPFKSVDDFETLARMHLARVLQEWRKKLSVGAGEPASKADTAVPPGVAVAEASDDDEAGLLELGEEFEDRFEEAAAVLTRIEKATELIGKRFEEHTTRVASATAAGHVTRAKARRMISKAANDMNGYAAKLRQDVPALRGLLQAGLGALSKAISLWPDVIGSQSNRDQAAQSLGAMRSLREVLSVVEAQVQSFLDAVSGMPRITAELNKARRSMVSELQSLIDLIRLQQQLLTQAESAASGLLSKPEEPEVN